MGKGCETEDGVAVRFYLWPFPWFCFEVTGMSCVFYSAQIAGQLLGAFDCSVRFCTGLVLPSYSSAALQATGRASEAAGRAGV